MPAIQLTCPIPLRCAIWLDVDDASVTLTSVLTAIGGAQTQERDLIVVTLPDPEATVRAARALLDAFRGTLVARFRLLLASRAGVTAIPDDARAWLAEQAGGSVIDPATGGACALSHYGSTTPRPIPIELADERLPSTPGLLVWIVGEEPPLRVFTQDRVTVGRIDGHDIVLPYAFMSRRHVLVEREGSMWTARDYESTSGFGVNGQSCRSLRHELRAGTVLQFAIPCAIVVLATRT